MKRKNVQVLFRKPVEILEVWRSKRLHLKNDMPPDLRRGPLDWTPFDSPFGAVTGDGLFLNHSVAEGIDARATRVLLLVSDHPSTNNYSYYPAGCSAQANPHHVKLDVFAVDPREDWPVLLIPPTYVRPVRKAFQVASLQPGETVELRLNGKSDGYHQRMYLEWSYLLRRSGPFQVATFQDGPFRVDPAAERRVVDLRKPLW